jgi:MraZ protein
VRQWERVFRVMNRFLSNVTNKIDAKGRVSVPSVFRSVLAERKIGELYCFQDFVFPAISAGGLDLLDRFERQIAAEDPFSAEANQMSLLIHGGGVFMKLDAEGRLMVTDFIRDFTGISDEVTFVGRADHFQLWQPEAFQALQTQARGERRLAGRRSE